MAQKEGYISEETLNQILKDNGIKRKDVSSYSENGISMLICFKGGGGGKTILYIADYPRTQYTEEDLNGIVEDM